MPQWAAIHCDGHCFPPPPLRRSPFDTIVIWPQRRFKDSRFQVLSVVFVAILPRLWGEDCTNAVWKFLLKDPCFYLSMFVICFGCSLQRQSLASGWLPIRKTSMISDSNVFDPWVAVSLCQDAVRLRQTFMTYLIVFTPLNREIRMDLGNFFGGTFRVGWVSVNQAYYTPWSNYCNYEQRSNMIQPFFAI